MECLILFLTCSICQMKNVSELYYSCTKEISLKLIFRRLMVEKESLYLNVPISIGGTGHLPLTYCFLIFQVQNYLFLHPCQQFRQDLSIWLPDLVVVWVVCLLSYLDILHLQILWCHLTWIQPLQTLVYYTLNLVLSKIFHLDQQHSLSFHFKWIGAGLQGPVLLTWLLLSLIPWLILVAILILVFKGSFKTLGCQIIY